jgi:hypothetical protein
MRVLLAAVLLVAALGCGGGSGGAEPFAIYHLELALGPPGPEGDLRCGPPRTCPGVVAQPAPLEVRYEVLSPPVVEAEDVDASGAEAVGSAVSIPFTASGRAAFARLTRQVARYGGRDQGWHHLAVVVGDEVVAFPEVDFDAYPDGIPDAPGLSVVALDPSDARALARRIRGDG